MQTNEDKSYPAYFIFNISSSEHQILDQGRGNL